MIGGICVGVGLVISLRVNVLVDVETGLPSASKKTSGLPGAGVGKAWVKGEA